MNQPQAPYPPPPRQKSGTATWIIVLLLVFGGLVVFIGIGSILAIYGVRKYIANAKTAEARSTLGQIAREAVAAYERDGHICPSASAPVPAVVPHAAKYQSAITDWEVDKASNAGFACLGFSLSMPQYYQYSYDETPTSFKATARGDLDGDGVTSEFSIEGKLVGGALDVAPTILEVNPEE